jgi:type 1 glutamine amidotransferase
MKPTRPTAFLAAATLLATLLPFVAAHAEDAPAKPEKLYAGKPLQGLLITGGCCHNYLFQAAALTKAVEEQADIEWKVVNEGGTGTRGEIDLYNDPDWAKPYDVIVHNECFADTDSEEYVKKITAGHKAGKPAVVIHCAMHTYRAAKFDDWRELLGVTSMHHEHQSKYPVKVVAGDHPIMKGFPKDWVTPMDELYILKKVWPTTKALATSKSEISGEEQPVFWTSDFHGARVFGTTYGHSDDTFRDPVYLNALTRGILWAAGKLPE